MGAKRLDGEEIDRGEMAMVGAVASGWSETRL
jgi:hypothetical protein